MSSKARRAARRKMLSQRRARSIERRLARSSRCARSRPVLSARAIEYELAPETRGIAASGIGLIHRLVQTSGLAAAIDRRLALLKVHLPYHESDHVLSLAYNVLAGGSCIEDLERLRQDEGFLDALGAERIPDPTTAGDFCRRFDDESKVRTLMSAINDGRRNVWTRQDERFFDEAVIDADGTLVATDGECKEGCDFAYDGTYGYHVLLVSLRNTQEPLFLVNRPGNRPSQEGAADELDAAMKLCRDAGFKRIRLQGDTAFSQSVHLDRWHDEGVSFLFGWDCTPNLLRQAAELPRSGWSVLERPVKHESTTTRARPENVKQKVVAEREFRTITTEREEVADFEYQPTACARTYRMVVLKKTLKVVTGQQRLQDESRCFFFITNDRRCSPQEIVVRANARCEQENLIEQLKNGAKSMRMPVGDRISNWAYMVMTSLAWTLKAWLGLHLSAAASGHKDGEEHKKLVLRMEFKRFLASFMQVPAQIVRTGRRILLRLLAWNPLQPVFLRAAEILERPLRC